MKTILVFMALVFLVSATAEANPVFFSGASGNLSSSAVFTLDGDSLTLKLTNTSAEDVLFPSEVLTALFWSGTSGLIPRSAMLFDGSVIFFGNAPGGNVGGEWAYRDGLSGAPSGVSQGVSSAGFGLFGPGDLFPGANLQGTISPDGLQYGIVGPGDNPETGNSPVSGGNALIRNVVIFEFGGASGIDLSKIGSVSFQYGTSLTDPNVPSTPAPSAIILAATGLVALILLGWSRKKVGKE